MFHWVKNRLSHTHVRDFLKVFTGNVTAQAISFLAFLLVARHLGVETFGRFSTLWALFVIMAQINEFGLATAFVKEYATRATERKTLVAQAFTLRLLVSVLLTLPLYLAAHPLALILNDPRLAEPIGRLALLTPAYALFLFLLSIHQSRLQFLTYSLRNITMYAVRLIGAFLMVLWVDHADADTFALLFGASYLSALLFLPKALQKPVAKPTPPFARGLLYAGFWMVLAELLNQLLFRADLLMLHALSGEKAVGFYGAALQTAMVFPLVASALFTSLYPKTAQILQRHSVHYFIRQTLRLGAGAFILLIVAETAGYGLFPLLYGADYRPAVPVMAVLLLLYATEIPIKPLVGLLHLKERTRQLSGLLFAQLLINVALDYLLIPSHGALGAAWASLTAKLFAVAGTLFLARRLEN